MEKTIIIRCHLQRGVTSADNFCVPVIINDSNPPIVVGPPSKYYELPIPVEEPYYPPMNGGITSFDFSSDGASLYDLLSEFNPDLTEDDSFSYEFTEEDLEAIKNDFPGKFPYKSVALNFVQKRVEPELAITNPSTLNNYLYLIVFLGIIVGWKKILDKKKFSDAGYLYWRL